MSLDALIESALFLMVTFVGLIAYGGLVLFGAAFVHSTTSEWKLTKRPNAHGMGFVLMFVGVVLPLTYGVGWLVNWLVHAYAGVPDESPATTFGTFMLGVQLVGWGAVVVGLAVWGLSSLWGFLKWLFERRTDGRDR